MDKTHQTLECEYKAGIGGRLVVLHKKLPPNFKRRKKMIVELLDKYHVDEFDDLLIKIIKHMKEQKETRQENEDE